MQSNVWLLSNGLLAISWSLSCVDPNVWFLVLKLTLVVELWVLLPSHWPPCPSTCFNFPWQYSYQERPMKNLTTICHECHRALTLRCQNGGEVVSAVIILVFLLAAIAHLTQTAWSSRVMCVNWNQVWASHLHYTGSLRAGGCRQYSIKLIGKC